MLASLDQIIIITTRPIGLTTYRHHKNTEKYYKIIIIIIRYFLRRLQLVNLKYSYLKNYSTSTNIRR